MHIKGYLAMYRLFILLCCYSNIYIPGCTDYVMHLLYGDSLVMTLVPYLFMELVPVKATLHHSFSQPYIHLLQLHHI